MVAAGNEIYVFGPGGLEAQADVDEFFGIYGAAKSILTNLIVLTEGTAECTAGKKDSSAATKNCYERFFAKMEACKSNTEIGGLAAEACGNLWSLSLSKGNAINFAFSRALYAVFV